MPKREGEQPREEDEETFLNADRSNTAEMATEYSIEQIESFLKSADEEMEQEKKLVLLELEEKYRRWKEGLQNELKRRKDEEDERWSRVGRRKTPGV